MAHLHTHNHAGAPHGHEPSGPDAQQRILWAILLTGGFMMAEFVGGLVSGSLALLADAGHMLTDVGALTLAYAGIRVGQRPGDSRRSFGYRRLEVLAAFVNGVVLLALSAWIIVEAARRLLDPVEVLSGTMLVIALLGLAVNLGSFVVLKGAADHSVSVGSALVHVLGDVLGSVAAIAAALIIRFTGWTPIDPILSALVACLIVRSGWDIVRRSGHILLEGTPDDIDRDEIRRVLADIVGVAAVHHIHVWSLTSGVPLATLHLRPTPEADLPCVLGDAKAKLRDKFGIDHSTIELEFRPDP